jgi:hypothetical protein
MANSARWVQNSGVTGQWAVKRRLDIQSYGWKGSCFWRQKVVIFGVIFTGPHVLYVIQASDPKIIISVTQLSSFSSSGSTKGVAPRNFQTPGQSRSIFDFVGITHSARPSEAYATLLVYRNG